MDSNDFFVQGFRFAGVFCGIKEKSKKLDLALIVSEVPASVAGVFTSNVVKAPSVILDLEKIKSGLGQAIVINSGNANVCTGDQGFIDAQKMVDETAASLNLDPALIYVSSTGKIGPKLPIKKVIEGIRSAADSLDESSADRAAKAILTTDRFIKIHQKNGKIGRKPYTILGFAKGAGMLEPAMNKTGKSGQRAPAPAKHATMLAYFMTDLQIDSPLLQDIFSRVMDATFNRVTVDGDMSTNDTALILANGLAQNPVFKKDSAEAKQFEKDLTEVAKFLALKLVEDGEGATKVVEIEVRGSKNTDEARLAAYAIGRSELVKTSFFGEDPNWGRILAALGYSGIAFDPSKVDIFYGKAKLTSNGLGTGKTIENKAHQEMKKPYFKIIIDLKQGDQSFQIWTSDLTTDYVKLNAEYRT